MSSTNLREVSLPELVLLDLEASLEDLFGLGASDGDVASDLLVSSNTEGSDGVSSLGGDGGLTSELLKNLGGSGEAITRLSDGDVCGSERVGKEDGEKARGEDGAGKRRAREGTIVSEPTLGPPSSRRMETH